MVPPLRQVADHGSLAKFTVMHLAHRRFELPLAQVLSSYRAATFPAGSPMNIVLIGAILTVSATAAYAQDHQPDTAKLKADAENLVNIISGDKLKIQTYCEILDLDDQIDDANLNQDTKKATELSEQEDELKKKLGLEFSTLANDLKDIDPNSQDGREIGSIINRLDQTCGD
jgi:hypothetical protein